MNINKIQKRVSDGERFAQISKSGESIFHAGDLANFWNIHNKNTLYTTISRYIKRGLFFRVHNGLYSIKKPNELNPYFLGIKALHRPAYVSCESILYEHGIINQRPQAITLISSISKSFSVGERQYRVKQMRDKYLFNDNGIEATEGVRRATPARAVADMLYFNPTKYFDVRGSSLVDWRKIEQVARNVGYVIEIPSKTKR